MAFVDTLITETDATVFMVDRNDAPGGHWPELMHWLNRARLNAPRPRASNERLAQLLSQRQPVPG